MPDLENLEQRIDRDRRTHERDLFTFLLSLFGRARDHAYAALRVGMSPLEAIRDVLMGNRMLALPGGTPGLAQRLVNADVAGFRRTTLVLPPTAANRTPQGGSTASILPPPTGLPTTVRTLTAYAPAADYRSIAAQILGKMTQTLQRKLAPALADASGKGQRGRQDALRDAFVGGGYVESLTSKAWLLDTAAVTLTGFAFGAGWWNGWQRPEARERLTGFEFVATIDHRSSDICPHYNGVKLPTDHLWWQYHWPSCHFNCRSYASPLFGDFTATENPPWQPAPLPGFGTAPATSVGLRYSRVA